MGGLEMNKVFRFLGWRLRIETKKDWHRHCLSGLLPTRYHLAYELKQNIRLWLVYEGFTATEIRSIMWSNDELFADCIDTVDGLEPWTRYDA